MLLKLMLFSKESQLLPNWVLCEWQFIKERKARFLGYSHCALSDSYWSHMPLYWVKCNLTLRVRISCPCSQKAKRRLGGFFVVVQQLIELQFEFLWHQQKFKNHQQCAALKRAVGLMKQWNRQLQSTWIHSAHKRKLASNNCLWMQTLSLLSL